MSGLFDGPAPRVRTILASESFLDVLAAEVVSAIPLNHPFSLSDALILTPNRRASVGLASAFSRVLGGAALLPRVQPLADLDDFEGGSAELADARPIGTLQRLFELARLVRVRQAAEGEPSHPAAALAWAQELAELLDSAAAAEEVDWSRAAAEAQARDLARHWDSSARFLAIVADYWPQRLSADRLADPAQATADRLRRLARRWQAEPPSRPIVVAGSTGSLAPVRALMKAVAFLPRGAVVLPGLDPDLDDATWHAIDPQHPQYALKRALAAMGVSRAEVARLGPAENASRRARRIVLSEALAPAQATADWRKRIEAVGGAALVAQARQGLWLAEARTEEEEAQLIALLMRETAEKPNETAALVTADAAVTRRVQAKLARWGLQAQDSTGRRLDEEGAGLSFALLAQILLDDGDPIALLAWLKLPGTRLAANEAAKRAAISELERSLFRGARRWEDLASAVSLLREGAARALLVQAQSVLQPLRDARLRAQMTLPEAMEALCTAAEAAAAGWGESGETFWAGEAGGALSGLVADAIDSGEALGPVSCAEAVGVIQGLLAQTEIPPARVGHGRLFVWGVLEARLQRCDRMILAGLNEGIWPAPQGDHVLLSSAMRVAVGLPAPDERVGLAAHDFAQIANAPEVFLVRALRRDGSPTVASRWLWRLSTLIRAAGAEGAPAPDALAWARRLDEPARFERIGPPRPKPPAAARLQTIRFSEAETLIRNPYAIYARRILGLEPLRPPGASLGPMDRGVALHQAIEAFADGEDEAALLACADAALRAAGFPPERRVLEQARLRASARLYVAWSRRRRAEGFIAKREVKGRLDLGEGYSVQGRADLIELRPDGRADIVDYKTGTLATDQQVTSGLVPQLTLEAGAVARGGFAEAGVPPLSPGDLIYWRFGGRDPEIHVVNGDAATLADQAVTGMRTLLARYALETQAFLSKPRAQFANAIADFDHLARRDEWADAQETEE